MCCETFLLIWLQCRSFFCLNWRALFYPIQCIVYTLYIGTSVNNLCYNIAVAVTVHFRVHCAQIVFFILLLKRKNINDNFSSSTYIYHIAFMVHAYIRTSQKLLFSPYIMQYIFLCFDTSYSIYIMGTRIM